jgi:hypothetical protein
MFFEHREHVIDIIAGIIDAGALATAPVVTVVERHHDNGRLFEDEARDAERCRETVALHLDLHRQAAHQ